MSIKLQLLLSYFVIVLLVIVVGFISWRTIISMDSELRRVTDQTFPVYESLKKLKSSEFRVFSSATEILLLGLLKKKNAFVLHESKEFNEALSTYHEVLKGYSHHVHTNFPDEIKFLEAISKSGGDVIRLSQAMLHMPISPDYNKKISVLIKESEIKQNQFIKIIDQVMHAEKSELAERMSDVHDKKDSTVNAILVFVLLRLFWPYL